MSVVEWIDCVRDIHARKLAEQAAAEARASAEAAVRAKVEFLSILSDELRTPLTGILGLGELIGTDASLSTRDRHYLDLVQAASRQIVDVVNNVLDVSRLETGTVKLVQETFRLSDTLARVMAVRGPQAEAKGVKLTVHMPQTLPLTMGDPGRIGQIMLNMVDSAIKHSTGGEIRLKVDIQVAGKTAQLRVSVQDSGVGVAPDLLARLQERFGQGQTQAQAQAASGAGLGLSISRQLVALMGGVLGEGPLPAGGSEVWFELDLPLDPAEPVIDLEPAPIAAGIQPLRVLLAEDNAFSQELIKTILSPLGYQIDTVENGQSAIFAAQRNSYDLILMDIRMPGMDGHASSKAIRALGDRRAKVPIIALSAADKPSEIRECFAAGMNDHVSKPILTSALFEAIARHVKS